MTDISRIKLLKVCDAMRDWLATRPITHMITLQPNRSFCSLDFLVQRLQCWDARMNRELLGPKWLAQTERRLGWIAFPENLDTTPHWHVLLQLTEEQESRFLTRRFGLEAAVDFCWYKLVPGGSTDTQPVTNNGAARYCTKRLHLPENYERYTLSEGLRH